MRPGRPTSGGSLLNTSRTRSEVWARSSVGYQVGSRERDRARRRTGSRTATATATSTHGAAEPTPNEPRADRRPTVPLGCRSDRELHQHQRSPPAGVYGRPAATLPTHVVGLTAVRAVGSSRCAGDLRHPVPGVHLHDRIRELVLARPRHHRRGRSRVALLLRRRDRHARRDRRRSVLLPRAGEPARRRARVRGPVRVAARCTRSSNRRPSTRRCTRSRSSIVSWFGGQSYMAHKLASCVIGAGTVLVIGLIGRRLGGPRAGLIAAVIAAAYPNLWLVDGLVLSEDMFALMIGLTILAAYRFRDRPGDPVRTAARWGHRARDAGAGRSGHARPVPRGAAHPADREISPGRAGSCCSCSPASRPSS